jgi:peptidoglycan/xylan/chitin deacetylase (PgdA/CDA1 family)
MFKTRFHILSLFVLILLIHVVLGIFYTGYSPAWVGFIIIVYFLVLFLGSALIRLGFYIKSQLRLPLIAVEEEESGQMRLMHNPRKVALTFDDGPAEFTEEILGTLKSENVRATFFLIGKNIAGHEELVKRMQEEGHVIGNHSFEHGRNFDWKSSRAMKVEIEKTNAAIAAITGTEPLLFRPPFGVTNPNLARAIRTSGMKSVGWSIRSFDTLAKSEAGLRKRISRQLKPGAIVLLHDRCAITAKMLPELIKTIREKGYSFDVV